MQTDRYMTFVKLIFSNLYFYVMTLVLILISIHLSFTYHKYLLCPFIQQENNDKVTNDNEGRTHNKLTVKTNLTHAYLPYALFVSHWESIFR